MSNKLLTEVLDSAPFGGTKLLTLVVLADFANDDGECWPSIDTLAARARVGRRWVLRILDELEADGWVVRKPRRGRATVYFVSPVAGGGLQTTGGVQATGGLQTTGGVAYRPRGGGLQTTQNPKEPRTSSSARAREADGLVTKWRTDAAKWIDRYTAVPTEAFLDEFEIKMRERREQPSTSMAINWAKREQENLAQHPQPSALHHPGWEFGQ
jgi:hypothetical protein